MKQVNIPVTAKDFKKLADEALVAGDVVTALGYLSSAIKDPTLNQKQLASYKKDFSRALAMRSKHGYATDVLFSVLYDYSEDKEALSLVMYNYQALFLNDQAQYYYKKCEKFLNKRKRDFMTFLEKTPNDTLIIDGEEVPIEEITEEAVDTFLGGDLLKQIKEPPKQSIFTVISAQTKFQDLITKMYEAAARQDYAGAIDFANQAVKLNVKKTEKAIAYYTKGVALMLMGYNREALEFVDGIISDYEDDYPMHILKCEIMANMKDKGGLLSCLKYFNERELDEVMPFDRIMALYLQFRMFDEALEFLKPRMKNFTDSYTLNIYLGMLYFNIGDVKKAKSIFAQLNGLYGDLCEARHLINYINYGIEKPLLVSPLYGNILELTTQYVNEFCMFLEQEGVSAISWATMDISNFIAKLKWISTNRAPDLAVAVIEKVYVASAGKLTKELREKSKELQHEIGRLLMLVDDLPEVIRECIAHYQILTHNKVKVVTYGKFYVADTMLDIFNLPGAVMNAVVRAFAFTIVRGEELYIDTLRFVNNLNAVYAERNFRWRSEYAVFALILYFVYGKKDISTIIPGFKYNKQLFAKYLEELTGETI